MKTMTTVMDVECQYRVTQLTRRESEVLQLIVEGRTDAQIADILFVSRTTASNHVSHILSKLGVPNRTSAAYVASQLSSRQNVDAPANVEPAEHAGALIFDLVAST